uniref:Uncharacterized protein n=1 Tax=Brassica campestris TaxID=3711 RepID=M4FH11_BRACM|nr:unnamed protein product [Brassica rapa]
MNSDLPVSLVGGRVRPCRLFTDPFFPPVASFGEVSETDSEVIPSAHLKQRGSLVLDDGPRSEIQEGDLKVIRRKYGIHSSMKMRSSLEFERAHDGGPGEIASFEAYLVAGFRRIVPSLVAEVSLFFSFCPSQLTPSSWKTLMSIQVLGELYGLDTRSLREVPGVVTPLGTTGPVGNIARLPVSVLYDEYQQAGARRRRPFYAPPPRLTRLFLLRNRVRDMAAQRDLLVWQVRASARWELMKEWMEGRTECWFPEEEYRRHLLGSEGSDHHFGGCPQVDSRSAAESRVSGSPPF